MASSPCVLGFGKVTVPAGTCGYFGSICVSVQCIVSLSLQELIGKAQVVILHGHQLAANHHYALNLICQQCNELRHHSDLLADDLKRKQTRLQKTLELHTRLQQVEFRGTVLRGESYLASPWASPPFLAGSI